ncbi:hypothetical protein QQS21_011022 [Conoideocrella luteorostrata]|uniref:Uncharacterized protein n=1 Tax=Conoideocrella luteorostrata TaxID=1105319 RepID=A0AAJ0CGN7_9HYPO|nr:hypothetical protein QQS21_011022 [Conoideocrella luteorostrata]
MDNAQKYDVSLWEIHETEDDCTLVIRTDNGRVFYCQISPTNFHRSPQLKEQYFKCLSLLRSREEPDEEGDFYLEDACDWLSRPFHLLITRLAPRALTKMGNARPTLAQYPFPPYFVCSLGAHDEALEANELVSQDHGWGRATICLGNNIMDDLDSWTRFYNPHEVDICYDNPADVLIKSPR